MNKPVFIFFLLLLPILNGKAQGNLVPNHSFEDTISCPYSPANFAAVANWFNPTIATPDYYNVCSTLGAGVPQNDWGYQEAQEGNAYAGFGTYWEGENNYREYIAIELNTALEAGKRYYWCMFVSALDSVEYFSNNIGISLTKSIVSNVNTESLLNIPIYGNHDELVDDYLTWVSIGGTFIADGGEKFLYIGNFYNDNDTDVVKYQINDTGGPGAYYYADNIYLGQFPCVEPSLEIPNVFTPNGDGVNDLFQTIDNGLVDKTITIFNRWGNIIFEGKGNEGWNGKDQHNNNCTEGVYFVTVNYLNVLTNKTETKTGFIQLIR